MKITNSLRPLRTKVRSLSGLWDAQRTLQPKGWSYKKHVDISFLVPAHNEEKIISGTISHLLELPCKNYEIIVGLDGCTDGTGNIVKNFAKKNKKVKYFSLNLRKGKPAVINHIIKKARGDIIIINDADWEFVVKDKKSFEKFIGVFDDKLVGGIAESFPVEWSRENLLAGNVWFKMVAYSLYYWLL